MRRAAEINAAPWDRAISLIPGYFRDDAQSFFRISRSIRGRSLSRRGRGPTLLRSPGINSRTQ